MLTYHYKTIINSANREVIGQYEGDAGGLGGERLGSKGVNTNPFLLG